MSSKIGRREMIGAAGVAIVAGALSGEGSAQEAKPQRKIIGICGSPRKGKTTAAALGVCLQAAKEQDATIQTELIELADLSIPAYVAAGAPLKEGDKDDFPALAEKLEASDVVAIIVGSPVYFNNMSALCKAFLDRCMAFRKKDFALKNKVAGALAVGGARNGGQEMTVQSIQAALSGQSMLIVNTGQPSTRVGATLWNQNDSIAEDEFGVGTAKDLGRRVAEIAAKLAS